MCAPSGDHSGERPAASLVAPVPAALTVQISAFARRRIDPLVDQLRVVRRPLERAAARQAELLDDRAAVVAVGVDDVDPERLLGVTLPPERELRAVVRPRRGKCGTSAGGVPRTSSAYPVPSALTALRPQVPPKQRASNASFPWPAGRIANGPGHVPASC